MLKLTLIMLSLIFLASYWNHLISWLLISSFLLLILSNQHSSWFCSSGLLSLDYISYIMVLLSVWIILLAIMASQTIKKNQNYKETFALMNMALCVSLVLSFSTKDLLLFYIMFESSLIPTLILILGWGYQPERLQAGIYMIFYTLLASLPLLVSIMMMYSYSFTLTMELIQETLDTNYPTTLWYLSSITAFMVKLPVFLLHLWLPKAHVEAPVGGSMILAGILLKLGGYGLIRVLPLFNNTNNMMNWLWTSIGIFGGFLVSIMCLHQTDMKSLIAHSSVAHMGLVLCAIMTMSNWSISGSLIIMTGHGLCSSGLFYIANVSYERLKSRSFFIAKGLLTLMPSMSLWWFLLSVGNIGAPPTINLIGEITILISAISWNKTMILGLSLLSFFGAAFTFYLYSLTQHGTFFSGLLSISPGKTQEFMTLFLHWAPLNIMILKWACFIDMAF